MHGHREAAAPVVEREPFLNTEILIVDDCVLHRDSLAAALAASGVPVAGCAWDPVTVVTGIRDAGAGVVLLNIATRDSTALLRAALATDPAIRVVVLGVSHDDEAAIISCAEAGVAGYHTRTDSFEDLVVLLKKVAAGESFCPPLVSAVLLRRLSTLASQQQAAVPDGPALTAREAQILDMLRRGLSNRDIADELCIAVHTVKNHVHSVLTKLGVRTRAQAVAVSLPRGSE
ncbi:response regulator transcription factor [Mycobacterium sp. AMU20-3851]|uniref:response regulator transcription factor n=1 Tax=Mycobacterium sp. AMU20-3851 TaxID=3122055 RepID=UPI003754D357